METVKSHLFLANTKEQIARIENILSYISFDSIFDGELHTICTKCILIANQQQFSCII